MSRNTLLALLCLALTALAAPAAAQEPKKRIVNVGGGPGEMAAMTAGWPKPATKAAMTDADRSASLDAFLEEMTRKDLFSGVVVAARAGKPAYRKAFGLASREWNAPNRPDTLFNIGSIDKTLTQLAIKLLVKDGAFSPADTVARVLPDYKGAGAERITLKQLLDHTSGMGDIFGPAWQKMPRNKLRSISDYRPLFENEPLRSEPGAQQSYSNAGYVLLGLVVEKAAGKPYDVFVKERILDPLGMKSTGFLESDAIVPNRATGYTHRGPAGPLETFHANIHLMPGKPSSAGGGDSTADDLVLLGEGLRKDTLSLGNPQPDGGMGMAGGIPGANAALEVCAKGVTVAVVSNLDPPSAEYVADQTRKLFACGGD
ncbi:MAG: serine hydrolase domain-containing protein [Acidobacteriota bacterium]